MDQRQDMWSPLKATVSLQGYVCWLLVDQGIGLSKERLVNQVGFGQLCSLREEKSMVTGLHLGTAPGWGRPPMEGVSQVAKPFMTCCGQS